MPYSSSFSLVSKSVFDGMSYIFLSYSVSTSQCSIRLKAPHRLTAVCATPDRLCNCLTGKSCAALRSQAFFSGLSALPAQFSAAGWLRVFSAPGRVRACAELVEIYPESFPGDGITPRIRLCRAPDKNILITQIVRCLPSVNQVLKHNEKVKQ